MAGGLNRELQHHGKDGTMQVQAIILCSEAELVWLYRKLAGMNADPEKPGYRHIIFRPEPVSDISSASYSNLTLYGVTSIEWKKESGKFVMNIIVPAGCTATVFVPDSSSGIVTEGGKKITGKNGAVFVRMEKGYAVYKVSSGKYRFESPV